jgi:purine-binding chemotaxis protein CheW
MDSESAGSTKLLAHSSQEILHLRAQALAREEARDIQGEARLKVIEFRLAHETYAIESAYVREVYPLKELTPMPCTPAYVTGIVNVRGQILTVIDLKKFFDLPDKGITELNKVIVVRTPRSEMGILVDEIIGVRLLEQDVLQATLPTLTGIRAEYLRGITPDRTVVLDAARLLSDQRLIVSEEVI